MNDTQMIKDTLFIDMKYVILYHIMGFEEIQPDIFKKSYGNHTIRIWSEKQYFDFMENNYKLTHHKDFVIFECLDRLLELGYPYKNIKLDVNNCDIQLYEKNNNIKITCFEWSSDYDINKFLSINKDGMAIIYSSRLSGGLIDRKYTVFNNGKRIHSTIFEKTNPPNYLNMNHYPMESEFPREFQVEDGKLIKYLGNDEKVIVPNGIWKIESGAFWNLEFIKQIVIPETVRSIGGDAFIYCSGLQYVNIPKSVYEIGDDPFAGANNLTTGVRHIEFSEHGVR